MLRRAVVPASVAKCTLVIADIKWLQVVRDATQARRNGRPS
jgi:hypothetical protein